MGEIVHDPSELWPSPWREMFFPSLEVKAVDGPVVFPDAARRRHFMAAGLTGKGKTSLLTSVVISDVARRVTGKSDRGVGTVDISGNLDASLRARLALMAIKYPILEDLVYLIDPANPDWSVRYNPLELRYGETPEALADRLAKDFTELYGGDQTIQVRVYRVLKHALLALILARGSLSDLPKLLRSREDRETLVSSLRHPMLLDYWMDEFPKNERDIRQETASTLRRLDVLFSPHLENFFTGPSTIDFRRDFLQGGGIPLIKATKAELGAGASYLFAGLMSMEFRQAAISRLDLAEEDRVSFALLLDEWHAYSTTALLTIAKELRQFCLELGLISQEIQSVLGHADLGQTAMRVVENLLAFALSYDDGRFVVKEFFTPDLDQVKDVRVRYQKVPWLFGEYVEKFEDPLYRSMEEIWELEIRKLTNLPDRFFWWKRRGEVNPHLIETPYVAAIKDLAPPEVLCAALARQDAAAFALAGVRKVPRLPWPQSGEPDGYDPYGW